MNLYSTSIVVATINGSRRLVILLTQVEFFSGIVLTGRTMGFIPHLSYFLAARSCTASVYCREMEPPTLLQRYFLPLIYLVSILALAARPGIYRTLVTLPIMMLLLLQLPLRREKGNFGDDYPLNFMALTLAFTYFDWIVLANPDKEQWHKIRGETKEKREHDRSDRVPSTFIQRLWWAARLTVYLRGTGWSHQSKNVPDGHPADYPKL